MRPLNIDVSDSLLERWVEWFSPAVQPFLADADLADRVREQSEPGSLSAEVRDTFCLYARPSGLRHVWLSEAGFLALPRADRSALVRAQHTHGREVVPSVRSWVPLVGEQVREQADGHRFVWWPSLLHGCAERVLQVYVEEGRRPSRHDEVPDGVWEAAAPVLPGARALAGTYAVASGPNCFGTVMAGAGVVGADTVWMQREPFEGWLSAHTRPGGDDDHPGTVLVWRSPDRSAQHAAVTLGEGWVLHKPSQGWMSPIKVLTTDECKASSRGSGRRLERHTLLARARA